MVHEANMRGFESMPYPLIVVDDRDRVIFANSAAGQLTGQTMADLVGRFHDVAELTARVRTRGATRTTLRDPETKRVSQLHAWPEGANTVALMSIDHGDESIEGHGPTLMRVAHELRNIGIGVITTADVVDGAQGPVLQQGIAALRQLAVRLQTLAATVHTVLPPQ